jgi:hypothetical protein
VKANHPFFRWRAAGLPAFGRAEGDQGFNPLCIRSSISERTHKGRGYELPITTAFLLSLVITQTTAFAADPVVSNVRASQCAVRAVGRLP